MQHGLGKILLVDDDKFAIQFFGDILTEHKLDFHSAQSGQEAIERISKNQYDLIIADIVLGDHSGIDILKYAKKHNPSVEVILITAHSTIDNVLEALKFGATDYLKKPVSGHELLITINRIVERKALINGYNAFKRYYELLQISRQISSCQDIESLTAISMECISHFFLSEEGIIVEHKPKTKKKYKVTTKHNLSAKKANTIVDGLLDKNSIDFSSQVPYVRPSLICIPVFFQQQKYLILLMGSEAIKKYNQDKAPEEWNIDSDIHFLQEQVNLSLKNIINLNQANKLALTDDVTGLKNQRYLATCLDNDLKRSQKTKEPLAILFIDIDHFKSINDSFGHLIGSQILKELAEVMRQSVRERDQIIRYGGDEYVITLPGLNSMAGATIAERLRENVEHHIFLRASHRVKITISIGVASYPETSFTKEEILTLADKALYEAKKLSRNAVYNAADLAT